MYICQIYRKKRNNSFATAFRECELSEYCTLNAVSIVMNVFFDNIN